MQMQVSAWLVLLLVSVLATSAQQLTGDDCRDNLQLLYDAPSIATLPAKERLGIIAVLLPELKASQSAMGFDTTSLTPHHLSSLLRFKELTGAAPAERVVAVTFQEADQCGNHGQCPAYLLGIGPQKVRSLIAKGGPSGISVGGSWGAVPFPREGSTYPDLLFLATISGSAVDVECFRWQHQAYASGCDLPCARVLAHPDR